MEVMTSLVRPMTSIAGFVTVEVVVVVFVVAASPSPTVTVFFCSNAPLFRRLLFEPQRQQVLSLQVCLEMFDVVA